MEILAVKNLSFSYPEKETKALDGVSFSLSEGDLAVICGATGSGKSTLLRMLKRELTPLGTIEGEILYRGSNLNDIPAGRSAQSVGFVMQRAEQQIVTDKVWHELAFGLENIGCPRSEMNRRIAETAQFFGMEEWFEKDTAELSGGQKQLLNLAAVTAMRPDILILDEPTSRLDPVAAAGFFENVKRLNRETGMTVLIAEHRLEEVISVCSKMLVLNNGRLVRCGTPQEVCAGIKTHDAVYEAMPASVRLYNAVPKGETCPLDVAQGRKWLESNFESDKITPEYAVKTNDEEALSLKKICFRYERSGKDVLKNTDLSVKKGEVLCLLGGNGSGKTTALCAAAGLIRPYSGEIRVFGRKIKEYKGSELYKNCVAMLPQDVQTLFLHNGVREELESVGIKKDDIPFGLKDLASRHPYDISGGEQQLVGLTKVLASKPRLLLLDEPTNGVDAQKKRQIIDVIKKLKEDGVTIVMVTHDTELAAYTADRCALFFRGSVAAIDEPHAFFSGSGFYTTAADRMTRGIFDGCITVEEAAQRCGEAKNEKQ